MGALLALLAAASSTAASEREGAQRRWPLRFSARLADAEAKQPIVVTLTGEWVATVSAVRDGEYDVAYELAQPRFSGAGTPTATDAERAALLRALGRRFFVTYRADGLALRAHFARGTTPSERNLLQMIVTETQLVGAGGGRDHWTAMERDGGGEYLAAYQRRGGVLVKRKLKYLGADGAASPLAIKMVRSEQRFIVDAAGSVVAVTGENQMRLGLPLGDRGQITIGASTRLDRARTQSAPELIGSLATADVESAPICTQQLDPAAALLAEDRRLLDGQSADVLLTAARRGTYDRALAHRLAALFRRQPATVAPAAALARAAENPLVTRALAAAGSDEAMAALSAIAHDRKATARSRIDALSALVFVAHPSVAAMRAPSDLLDEGGALGDAARLVAAALGRAGAAEHPGEAEEIDRRLLSRWDGSSDAAARIALLEALGNSASPRVAPTIEQALRDRRAEVRAAAANALRLVEGEAAERLLAHAITDDADGRVRAAAIAATGFRNLAPLTPALRAAAARDPESYVRAAASARLVPARASTL